MRPINRTVGAFPFLDLPAYCPVERANPGQVLFQQAQLVGLQNSNERTHLQFSGDKFDGLRNNAELKRPVVRDKGGALAHPLFRRGKHGLVQAPPLLWSGAAILCNLLDGLNIPSAATWDVDTTSMHRPLRADPPSYNVEAKSVAPFPRPNILQVQHCIRGAGATDVTL